jgi:cell division inhibitor SepF
MWRKAMLYLGLGPDEEYDDFEVTGEHKSPASQHQAPARPSSRRGSAAHRDPEPSGSVRTLTPSAAGEDLTGNGNGEGISVIHEPSGEARGRERAASRRSSETERPGRSRGGVVRPLPTGSTKPFVVDPSSFNDAQEVADKFKVNVPVILNLQGVERDLSRRIIDFASGLCYGLGGQMERVANQVYLLTPSDVEVSLEERRRLRERGYEA